MDLLGPLTFGMSHGYLESLVRGLRSTFLTDVDYASLKECTDMKGEVGWADHEATRVNFLFGSM